MNILDIIFILFLAYCAYRGYQKGLFAAVSRVASYVIAVIGAMMLYQPLALFLGNEMRFREVLSPWVADKMAIPAASFQTEISDVAFDQAKNLLETYQLPEVFNNIMMDLIGKISEAPAAVGLNTLGESITYSVSGFILNALSFVLIYTMLSVLFRIIIPKLFTGVNPRPITFIDKIGGSVLNIGGGIITIGTIVILFTPLASMAAMKSNQNQLTELMSSSIAVNTIMSFLNGLF
ncbi:CvpA family protein [Phosphitispora sp. TUW77]|uniref:CvpA family protein n=1 Tax=Phosphitispora sp. TUW77 TaxID=3152361 RepID=UPI003AB6D7F9